MAYTTTNGSSVIVTSSCIQHNKWQCDPVKILLRDNATPYSVCTARRVPIPLLPQVEAELRRMEEYGIIERVTEPTDWCANGSCNETEKRKGAHLCRLMTPERVRDARETHFTYLGRRATQINRLDSLLETGRVKRIFADPLRPRKLKIDHLHNTFRSTLFPATAIRYYKRARNLPRQDGTVTRRSTRSGSHHGRYSHTRRNES